MDQLLEEEEECLKVQRCLETLEIKAFHIKMEKHNFNIKVKMAHQ